jgi:hypothetical protein
VKPGDATRDPEKNAMYEWPYRLGGVFEALGPHQALTMSATTLQNCVQAVVGRARSRGFVVPRDVREELSQAGVPDAEWREVLAMAGPQLSYRQGRYYFVSPLAARMRQSRLNQEAVQQAVQEVRRDQKALTRQSERREHERFPLSRAVTVQTADGSRMRLLSSDISVAGIRLLGAYNFQGQRVRVEVPAADADKAPWCFIVQIIWAREAADAVFENGGIFVEVSA